MTKEWEFLTTTFTFDTSYKYTGKEIKEFIDKQLKQMNLPTNYYTLQHYGLEDDAEYSFKRINLRYNMQFKIKYFDTNKFNNIIHDKNFKLYNLNVSIPNDRTKLTHLYELIDEEIIKGDVCLGALIVQRINPNLHLIMNGYCQGQSRQIPEEILCLVTKYYLSKCIDIYEDPNMAPHIAPNETLIMYKDYSHPYIDYDDVKKQHLTVYVQSLNVLKHEEPDIDFFNLVYDKDKLHIFEDKTMDSLRLNVTDGVQDVIRRIIEDIMPSYEDIPGVMRRGPKMDMIFQGVNISDYGMGARLSDTNSKRRVIDFGVKNGSILHCHTYVQLMTS